ncbi:MAG TPA: ribonuclease III [Caulobacteraceae bacterium]|jgi:ribonuclease-3|nr:ribonuclease III [Caulobacteraceae bacterium]
MNARTDAVGRLERRLGYVFTDPALLERALTHSSAIGGGAKTRDNEVLEFLGDRVIGLLAAERLADLHPEAPEGELSPRLSAVVSGKACAEVGRRMELGPALRLAGSETKGGGRDKPSILADAVEAVMAALYLDGGLAAARAVFLDLWAETFDDLGAETPRDPKTTLQEWAQSLGRPLPSYAVVARAGPDHRPVFTVSVAVEGLDPAVGQGPSRQDAEKAAAAVLLAREGKT